MARAGKNSDLQDMIKAAKRPAAKRPATKRPTATASKPATSKPVKAATSSAEGGVGNASTSKAPSKELAYADTPQDLVEEQPEPVPSQALRPEPVVGSVRVRYNHYNQSFNLSDGTLQWFDVEHTPDMSVALAVRISAFHAAGATATQMKPT